MPLSLGTEEWGSSSGLSLTSTGLKRTGGKARGELPHQASRGEVWH